VIRFGRESPEVLRPGNDAEVRLSSKDGGCKIELMPPRNPSGPFRAGCNTHCQARTPGLLAGTTPVQACQTALPCPQFARMTLGQYLTLRGYSAGFRDHYVAPMCAAVWSVPNAQVTLGGLCKPCRHSSTSLALAGAGLPEARADLVLGEQSPAALMTPLNTYILLPFRRCWTSRCAPSFGSG